MIEKSIILSTEGATLRLQANDANWCQVQLQVGEQTNNLGADVWDIVIERLRIGLSDMLAGPSAGFINGVEVVWLLSLAEQHFSVYVAEVDGEREFFFQDAEARLIAVIRLSHSVRHKWLSKLTEEKEERSARSSSI